MKFWLWGKCLRILLLQKLFSHSWLEKENDWSKEGKLSRISNWFRKGFTDQQVLFVKQFEFACNSKTTSSFQTEMGKGIKSGWYLQNFKVLLKSEWLASNFTNPRDSEWALTASLVVWPVLCIWSSDKLFRYGDFLSEKNIVGPQEAQDPRFWLPWTMTHYILGSICFRTPRPPLYG